MIPKDSTVYKKLEEVAENSECVAFSGLPGVGKSLYVNQFYKIAKDQGRQVTVIQWDIARKSFETPEISARYPMKDGMIHNGVKLSVGLWLLNTVKSWLQTRTNKSLLLIEAPLVGHRFVELAKVQDDSELESFLSSSCFKIIMPIPSKKVREKIEEDRKAQVDENAITWKGAKPSVMLLLWKMTCGIANEFGKAIPMEGQPPYDPETYEFVFNNILKHRHFVPLVIDEVFKIHIEDEDELHNLDSLAATSSEADEYADQLEKVYSDPEEINMIVDCWYLT